MNREGLFAMLFSSSSSIALRHLQRYFGESRLRADDAAENHAGAHEADVAPGIVEYEDAPEDGRERPDEGVDARCGSPDMAFRILPEHPADR